LEIIKIPVLFFNEVHSLHVILKELSRVENWFNHQFDGLQLMERKCNEFIENEVHLWKNLLS